MKTLLAFGLGYSARRVAQALQAKGWRIAGTGRSPESVRAIAEMGWQGIAFDGSSAPPELRQAVGDATHILISVPPGPGGDPVLRHLAQNLAAAPKLEWIGYLSTIGVYGDHGGAWVDEDTPPKPASERSIERLAAETAWSELARERSVPLDIFRLAGIYGPGRNPLERMKAGRERTIVKPGQVFNRIHVADIAATVIAGIEAGARATGVFNVTDDEPAAPEDVAAYAAELLGIEPPPLVPWEEAEKTMNPMARSFYSETKRVRNERIKLELGVRLAYPTYREGLGALAGGV